MDCLNTHCAHTSISCLILLDTSMHAYFFDNLEGDQRLPHDSGAEVSEEVLRSLGVLHWHIPVDAEGKHEQEVAALGKGRDYKNHDFFTLTKEGLGDEYEAIIKNLFHE
jgi:1,2-dihydroxy-3-keto-5-methylthiopentene dioxygenase